MKTINLIPGSADWLKARSASKAPAMMGCSLYQTRSELIAQMATGITKEVDSATQARFDNGHRTEALAREIAGEILGEDLSPVSGEDDDGYLTANYDGLTFCGRIGFEHKDWNETLAAAVRAGVVPDSHIWQLDQQILVGKLDYVLFMVSDGTRDKCVWLEYRSTPERAERLVAGWRQFDADLAEYQHVEVIPAAVAAPIKELPTLFVQAKGEVTATNMPAFKAQITEFLAGINMKPATDQEFADGKEVAKKLRELAVKIKERKADMLAQTVTIGEVAVEIDHLAEVINANALELEKAVKREEDARKLAIVAGGRTAFAEHVAKLNERLGKPYMPAIAADFAEAIKGKRLMTAMQDAVDTLLANKKIEASAIADKIQFNMNFLRVKESYEFLFRDAAQLVLKDADAVDAIVKGRIAEHKAAEEKRLEAERAKIRAEEEAKAQEKVKAEQEAEAKRIADEQAAAHRVANTDVAPLAGIAAAVATSEPACITTAIPAPLSIVEKQAVVIGKQDDISAFLASREWAKGEEAKARATIVEFVKFQAARNQKAA